MAMKAFGILLTATVAFASPNESRRQLQEGPCADLDADGDTDVSDLLSLLAYCRFSRPTASMTPATRTATVTPTSRTSLTCSRPTA